MPWSTGALCLILLEDRRCRSMPGTHSMLCVLPNPRNALIYRARERQSDRTVVLKAYQTAKLGAAKREAVEREIRLMRVAEHSGIVRLRSVLENDEYTYLVLEAATGERETCGVCLVWVLGWCAVVLHVLFVVCGCGMLPRTYVLTRGCGDVHLGVCGSRLTLYGVYGNSLQCPQASVQPVQVHEQASIAGNNSAGLPLHDADPCLPVHGIDVQQVAR